MTSRDDRVRRRGRRVALVVFGAIVSAITAIWSLQIIRQVWFDDRSAAGVECRPGLRALIDSVRRARMAAAEEGGGERLALARFRAEVDDAWRLRSAVGRACGSDRAAMLALPEIDRLRYAEEHAVRYEAVDLAHRRRRVRELEKQLWGESQPTREASER